MVEIEKSLELCTDCGHARLYAKGLCGRCYRRERQRRITGTPKYQQMLRAGYKNPRVGACRPLTYSVRFYTRPEQVLFARLRKQAKEEGRSLANLIKLRLFWGFDRETIARPRKRAQ
jgi:hypothetical protein